VWGNESHLRLKSQTGQTANLSPAQCTAHKAPTPHQVLRRSHASKMFHSLFPFPARPRAARLQEPPPENIPWRTTLAATPARSFLLACGQEHALTTAVWCVLLQYSSVQYSEKSPEIYLQTRSPGTSQIFPDAVCRQSVPSQRTKVRLSSVLK